MPTIRFTKLYKPCDWLLKLALLIVLVTVFVPFSPKTPAPGLDPSWALALNQAVALGLSFGKDIIFTLGPYSAIYTKAYHPATDLMMIAGSLYIAFIYWLGFLVLMRGSKWRWTISFGLVLLAMIYARDSLLFSYPLLVGLLSFKTLFSDPPEFLENQRTPLLFAILFTPFGLLPLIKGSLIILCFAILILCNLFFFLYDKKKIAYLSIASVISSLIVFWLAAGQSVLDLPAFFINSILMASGFTEAMAIEGNATEIILYLSASGLILGTIVLHRQRSNLAKLFLLSLFFVFLFISFKTGFTRHFGHAFISGTSILIAAMMLPYLLTNKIIIPVIFFSLFTANYIDSHYTRISIRNNLISIYTSAIHGLKTRLYESNGLKRNFDLSMEYLRQQQPFPKLPGTTDVYSYQQTYLIASGMDWLPRPIFQSYSVFSPRLSQLNAVRLQGLQKPDNIIFKIEPIDERVPSLEDGASWAALLHNYEPINMFKEFLLLQKKTPQTKMLALHQLSSEQHGFNERVTVPETAQPFFAEIVIQPTVWGYLAKIFFKPTQLYINFELQNGDIKHYRIIGAMAKSGFLISPLIENTAEFALLYKPINFLAAKKVKAFTITVQDSFLSFWQPNYTLRFKTMHE